MSGGAALNAFERDYFTPPVAREGIERFRTQADLDAHIARCRDEMRAAAANLDFERAAALRDEIKQLRLPDPVLSWQPRKA